jgi:hypothetical protein
MVKSKLDPASYPLVFALPTDPAGGCQSQSSTFTPVVADSFIP